MKKKPIHYFIVSIVILILIGFLSIVNTLNLLNLENDIAKNYKLSQIFEQTLTNSQKIHITTRNFIISGDISELKKRDLEIKLYNNSINNLKNQMADPTSLAFLNAINGLRNNRIKDYKVDYLKMRKERGIEYTLNYFNNHINYKIYTTEIPKLIIKIKSRQEELLKKSQTKSKKNTEIVILIIIIGTILSITIAVFAIFIIKNDIATRKNNENRLLDFTKKLKHRNNQLYDFSSIISHNLRAPLINIAMLTDYLEEVEEEVERKEILLKLKKVTTHINVVFDELTDSLQVLEDIEIKSEKINLESYLNKLLIQYETQIKQNKAEIKFDFSGAPEIYFPRKYVESILDNLLSNALKYKSPIRNPIIEFKTLKNNSNVILSVSDNGLGINIELHKKRLFKIRQVFHDHPDSKGFGLYMTKTQITAMGGEIWIESEVNKGSTFFIEFKNQNNETT
jgi:signal transduction histidine kinase